MKQKQNKEVSIPKSHRRRAAWQGFVRTMAMIVIFCTTYALILPAITMEPDIICTLEEHTHTDGCYETTLEQALVCTLSEEQPEPHRHDESCRTQPELICGTEETEGHRHEEACRDGETLVCQIPEAEPHAHSESCLSQPELVCTISEEPAEAHTHDETCWTEKEVTSLICAMQEHTHEEACYKQETAGETGITYSCGFTAHAHGETCHDADGNLVCTVPEHTHEAACAASGVDPAADLESAADWEVMIAALEFTDSRRENLLTVARSQIGYTESAANCILEGDELRGYTRYGDWYGNPYMAWDDAFIAFCLHYAGIPADAIPRDSDTDTWLAKLVQQGLTRGTAEQLPQSGDIVFFKKADGKLHTAIVENAESPDLETLQFRVIAGDSNNKVEKLLITLDSIAAVCDPGAQPVPPEPTGPEATEPEAPEPEPELVVHTAQTENYIVTVSHPAELILPEGAELRVVEYAKDSETYLLRCQEAGYELDWLLNIGFFLGDTELTLSGGFDVVVTSKQGDALGQDITHFADSGTERIDAESGDGSVSFTSGGFSDFGGGVARIAPEGGKYNFVTVNPANLSPGVDYILYVRNGSNITLLNSSLSAITTWAPGESTTHGAEWSVSTGSLGSDPKAFTWQIEKRNGNTYLVCQQNGQRLTLHNGWLQLTSGGTALHFNSSGSGAHVGGQYELRYDDQWRATWNGVTSPSTIYFAAQPNYPHAVHTGEVKIDRLRFYNLVENGEKGVGPLAGCTFEITGPNNYKATVVSTNDPELHLPSTIPNGTYTITEVSVPAGYVRDRNPSRTFTVKDGALVGGQTIGTFLNHNMEQLETGKTAEVEDYANRIYQIDMTAKSNMRHFEVDPLDLLFVVDKSNSMLFPSGLVDTGKTVTLRLDGQNNASNMDALDLDKSQVYYIIADPQGTSTVWAVWHDGTGWITQDASYYAKAKHANEPGYQDDNETVIFPENRSYDDQAKAEPDGVRSNGGGLGYPLGNSSLGKFVNAATNDRWTFRVYTATNEFNRLHYLEEALTNLIYQLADVSTENRVSLTRFTKEVLHDSDCFGPYNLTPDNVENLAYQVQHIKTSGGTRQDIALHHVYETHLQGTNNKAHTYTLLITDGAPVLSTSEGINNLGGPNDAATTTGNTVYGQIKGWANKVKEKSTLLTVALGMESVDAGKQVLKEIASGENNYCAADDAADLLDFVQNLLFKSFKPGAPIQYYGDITDEISDSFYPIAWTWRGQGAATGNRVLVSDSYRDWVLLEENDWITLDGKYTTAGAADAAGQLLRKTDGTFYVKWTNQYVSGDGWEGRFYVKAKEDFIGGNAIDTNKQAYVTVDGATEYLDTPTVNVRLLDMNQMSSEVTVYLGDLINGEGDAPLDSLKYFYENTKFTKLISGEDNVLNRIPIDSDKGLEAAVFYLRYAMGRDLTQEEWTRLINGNTIEVPYTYDDASSHGPVGYFTFKLEKAGTGSQYEAHNALSTVCQPGGQPLTENCDHPAETYTLNVTYTAYRLNQNGRPAGNVHNSASGPGQEVGTGTRLENGLGVVAKQNIHEVHVISGKIEIIKKFAAGTTDERDRTFFFILHRTEDGEDTSKDVTKTITIPAGASQGSASIVFDGLRRGTYTVTEAVDEDYTVKGITVLPATNSYTEPPIGGTAVQLTAVMGNNVANENVIGKADPADRYVSYTDPVNGVYAAAEFTNGPIVYPAEIPVEKFWEDAADHSGDAVYMALYLNDALVLDGDGNARLLRLDAESGWKGIFTVYLVDAHDSLDNYNYSIREVSQVTTDSSSGWNPAVLENDGTTIVYYEKTISDGGFFTIGGLGYSVAYGVGSDGALTVTNSQAVELPMTGGVGTHLYTISGLLLILAAALIYGYSQRRKTEGGACR